MRRLQINHYYKLHMYAGLRLPGDQRQMTPALPMHLVDLLPVGDGVHTFSDASGNSQYFVIYCSF